MPIVLAVVATLGAVVIGTANPSVRMRNESVVPAAAGAVAKAV